MNFHVRQRMKGESVCLAGEGREEIKARFLLYQVWMDAVEERSWNS